MRRTMAAFASIGLAAGTIALASPAQAAGSLTDNGDGSFTVSNLTFPPEFVRICAASVTVNTCKDAQFNNDLLFAVEQDGTYSEGSTVVTPGANPGPLTAGTYTIVLVDSTDPNNLITVDSLTNVTVGSGGGGSDSGSSSGSGSAPAPVMQQFGLPQSGNCEDGYSDSMNWSGVGNGGWGISWAQWVNDGAGGAVCSRTVMYDTSTAKWTVN